MMQVTSPKSELGDSLSACRTAFCGVGILSAVSNILMLTGSFYMLEVYDRVLPSRSVPTLVGLSVLAGLLFLFIGVIEFIRGRLMVRIGASLDDSLTRRVFEAIIRAPMAFGVNNNGGLGPVRDLDAIRNFLAGAGPTAILDMPWIPVYLAICFAFHFWIGITALAGALILITMTVLAELYARGHINAITNCSNSRLSFAESSRRNAEVVTALGMESRIVNHWIGLNRDYMSAQRRMTDFLGGLSSTSRAFRMALQSGVLGVGAFLVIKQEATSGVIIASSILTSRALAPVDLAIANWRGFVAARQSLARLKTLLTDLPARTIPMSLPAPTNRLSVEAVAVAPPGTQKVVVSDISFTLTRGNGLGVIGSSASGKSSLARMLVGVWRPSRGKVCIEGASLDQWRPEDLGRYVGYLPQNVELMAGTVAQNVARFQPDASADDIVEAARAAGVHDLIVGLPDGYETLIGEQGTSLSAGQRQRIALARALFGKPFLVVLDEPNSNLDAEGETALTQAILGTRARGAIVVVIAHRPSALIGVDLLLVLQRGRQQAFGPKEEILAKMGRRDQPSQGPLKVVSDLERQKP